MLFVWKPLSPIIVCQQRDSSALAWESMLNEQLSLASPKLNGGWNAVKFDMSGANIASAAVAGNVGLELQIARTRGAAMNFTDTGSGLMKLLDILARH
jgi:hypothetical protein